MKKILITGGAGFIGSNLALALLKKGYQVTILDNLSSQIHGDNPPVTSPLFRSVNGLFNFIHGDVTNRTDWEQALQGQDAVVHLAAETGTGQSMYQIEKYSLVNIGGTALLLDILANKKNTIRKVIVASSRAIYGEGKYRSEQLGIVYPVHRSAADMDKGDFEVKYPASGPLLLMPTDEESKIHPSSIYGITKQNQEQMVMVACKASGIAGVAFRYQNVYGPGQSLSNPYTGILSIFSTQIKNHRSINIFEDGKESRDFVYIDDVVDATIAGLENADADNETFNVGTGEAIDVITVANSLMKNLNTEVPVNITGNYRIGDIRHNYADLTKIKAKLRFKPSVDFNKGIARFAQWVNGQQVEKVESYERSLKELKEKGLLK